MSEFTTCPATDTVQQEVAAWKGCIAQSAWFQSLLLWLGRKQCTAQKVGPLPPMWSFLASAWPSPSC